ncbi:Hypothetical predicted protein [Mytilus galloprovincialis]|uniref:C2H2-type domain-containing protein n=1 Tax=Mytilus galloprovincialis TaxID=29158 RepID=A0A8B6GP74_MYTGA|nr:Hypothetical predicted protein [Mytilus galloprovincialis]
MENPDVLEYNEEEMETEMSELTKSIEFFFKPGGRMQCPVDDCGAKSFENRTKYQRHWEEKHTMKCVKYECSVAGCLASCRRKHDIKIHLVRQHYMTDMRLIQSAVEKCQKTQRNNKGFIDPGFFIYKNRVLVPDSAGSPERCDSSKTNSAKQLVPSPSDKTAHESPSPSVRSTKQLSSVVISNQQSASSDVNPAKHLGSNPVVSVRLVSSPTPSISLISSVLAATCNPTNEDDGPEFTVSVPMKFPTTSRISLSDYQKRSHTTSTATTSTAIVRNYNTSFGYSAIALTENSSQTSCLDYPPIQLPAIPESESELTLYLLFLSNSMDSLGRTRQVAKERLETLRKEGSKLELERKKRREVEVRIADYLQNLPT